MLENKEFYIKLKEEEFKVELIKFSDTLNKALVFIPEINKLEDLSPFILDEIKNFFENYKTLQKIEVKVGSYHNKDEALRLIETCKERYKKETGDDNG